MIRLVIADDHELVREGLRSLLEMSEDVKVVAEATNGPEALAATIEHSPDVLVADLVMPGFDGVELVRRARVQAPATRVLILTNFMDDSRVREALRAGAMGYLLKDVLRQDLLRAIETVATGKPFLHPDVQRQLMTEAYGAPNSPIDGLTSRERQVLIGIAKGQSNKEIAYDLGVSEGTIKGYVSGVFQKLEVADRTQAALFAIKNGLVKQES